MIVIKFKKNKLAERIMTFIILTAIMFAWHSLFGQETTQAAQNALIITTVYYASMRLFDGIKIKRKRKKQGQ